MVCRSNGGPRFDYKLRWLDRFLRHARDLLAEERQTVLAGDFNVIPTDLDVYAPERWRDDALFRPEVRAAYRALLTQGWVDALRTLHPDQRVYTFWKYLRNAFTRDAGLRIDHLLLSPPLAQRLVAGGVHREVRAREKPSDHAPAWIAVDCVPETRSTSRNREHRADASSRTALGSPGPSTS